MLKLQSNFYNYRFLNQMNMALVENVNVLETCIEAISSKF